MAVKKYKPTSAGRRQMATSSFEEITRTEPEKSLLEPLHEDGRPEQPRPHHDASPGRRSQAPLPADRLQARQGRRPGEGRHDRVRPEPVGPHRAAPLRRRREGLHPRARRPPGRRDGAVRDGRGHQARQRAAARGHPDGHERARGRAPARPGREDGPLGGLGRPARREGRAVRRPAAPVRRDAPRPAHVPRDRRPGRELRPLERVEREGGSQPLARQAPLRARYGHEPGRPSARRRRGQVEGPPPGDPVGRPDDREAHPPRSTRNPTS